MKSTNVDQKQFETELLIAICRPTGDIWQSKTLFLAIIDRHSSIVKSVYDCRLSGMRLVTNAEDRFSRDEVCML